MVSEYPTINQALFDVPLNSHKRFTIYVKEGTYNEHIFINDSMWSVLLCGDGAMRMKIIGNSSKDRLSPGKPAGSKLVGSELAQHTFLLDAEPPNLLHLSMREICPKTQEWLVLQVSWRS
ncbi:hypothetical protein C2S53_018370 [Perilla frutescens var. hirtella]|uniref:Pectinesterase n=1 Tax=Perilla frutescens var. hirtella TaxID=608512 RepID=A0AAD4NZU0_PERFH|nr:hypothetical protein C2S53_018370 [Perilla frutescens var. hirtella]